jgi:molecular chaperone GrpE
MEFEQGEDAQTSDRKGGTDVEEGGDHDQPKSSQSAGDEDAGTEKQLLADLLADLESLRIANEDIKVENQQLKAEIAGISQAKEREKEQSDKQALLGFAHVLIEVADNIRMAIEAVPKDLCNAIPVVKNLLEGVELTDRVLLRALSRYHVTSFTPIGEQFNPHLHNATSVVSAENVPPKTVVRVLQRGFMINERLLRPAAVVLADRTAASVETRRSASAEKMGYPARHAAEQQHASIRYRGAAPTDSAPTPARGARLTFRSAILHKSVISPTQGVPAATHPIWERLVTGQITHHFKMFAANMFIDQAKREYNRNNSAGAKLANELCTFVLRNATLISEDLSKIASDVGRIPPDTHPIWRKLITGELNYHFNLFAANILVDRARLEYLQDNRSMPRLAIELFNFSNRYADLMAADLALISQRVVAHGGIDKYS